VERNSELRRKITVEFNNALPAAYFRVECYEGLRNLGFKGAYSKICNSLDTTD